MKEKRHSSNGFGTSQHVQWGNPPTKEWHSDGNGKKNDTVTAGLARPSMFSAAFLRQKNGIVNC